MGCNLSADRITWNSKEPVEVSVQYQSQGSIGEAVLSVLSTDSYTVCSPSELRFTCADSQKNIKIRIHRLDKYQPTPDPETLGSINLIFRLYSYQIGGGRKYPRKSLPPVVLDVRSPYAYSHSDPFTSHKTPAPSINDESPFYIHAPSQNKISEIFTKICDNGQHVVWLSGYPGSGKTALLQALTHWLEERFLNGSGLWLPVQIHMNEKENRDLQTGWRFIWMVDRKIRDTAERLLGFTSSVQLTEDNYCMDFYLEVSKVFHRELLEEMKKRNCRLLLMLDGFYYFRESEGDLCLNLSRLAQRMGRGDFERFKLLITDVTDLESRITDINFPNGRWFESNAGGIPISLLTSDEIKDHLLDPWFDQSWLERCPDLHVRLHDCTGGHPVLLKAILHNTPWLYKGEYAGNLSIPTEVAHDLRQSYAKLRVIDSLEDEVLKVLLDNKDPYVILKEKGSQVIEQTLKLLQNKNLATRRNNRNWCATWLRK